MEGTPLGSEKGTRKEQAFIILGSSLHTTEDIRREQKLLGYPCKELESFLQRNNVKKVSNFFDCERSA